MRRRFWRASNRTTPQLGLAHVPRHVTIMASFDVKQRREFLQWLTGSPKLPIGGFSGLHPQLTIVKRPHEAPLTPDDYLAECDDVRQLSQDAHVLVSRQDARAIANGDEGGLDQLPPFLAQSSLRLPIHPSFSVSAFICTSSSSHLLESKSKSKFLSLSRIAGVFRRRKESRRSFERVRSALL